jgi:predicted nucleic acid-binding protein
MIVVEASAVLELILGTLPGRRVAAGLSVTDETLHAPALVDVEVLHVLRRLARARAVTSAEAEAALTDLAALDLERHDHQPLLQRAWELRENLTGYDAVYVALAEALDASLLTCDSKFTRTPGLRARVRYVS